jgi:WS/DGAT/MGAT family acyltransferase
MPKLSAVDQAFFLLETRERPMSIGALIVLAPPAGTGARFADRLVRQMLRRPVGPPFNGRLAPGPVRGMLTLATDEKMNPAQQLFRHQLPPGTDLHGLFERICRIHVKRLPRNKPLWEQHVFTGLPGHRVALYFKTHHGLIDGIGFLHALNSMISPSRSTSRPQAIWEGLRNVAPREAADHAANGVTALLRTADDAGRTARDMLRLMWHQGLRDVGLGRGLSAPFVSTPDVLKAPPSPNRVMGHCVLSLPQVRSLARAGGAKINDVLLTVLDMAMHRYLAERGATPDRPLIADMPVALEDHGGAGNRITILQVPMGRPGSGPARRLADIVQETTQVKQEMRTLASGALTLYSIIQHSIASTIEGLGLGNLPMLANAVISNPAGLEHRVYFNGAEVELALPVSVVAHHQVLNITITTYVEDLHVTFIALKEAVPDVQRLADYTSQAVAELEADLAKSTRRRQTAARPGKAKARKTTKSVARPARKQATVR